VAGTDLKDPDDPPGRVTTGVFLLLVFILSAFNAIALLPELTLPIPSVNDDAVHYLFVQRASEALARGENPIDHWVPELDLGFPQFFYYQHLPHLAVVLLHRLLLKQADLLTLFNLIRYLLLVGFPFTVYWSVRRLGFSLVAGAVAAVAATLLVSRPGFGFEYGSYIWRGYGMYTQLWAVHLSFITLACLDRLLERGTGYVAAVVASSALALSHLVYTYMMVPAALILLLVGLNRTNWRQRMARLAIPAVLTAVISSYLWLPWLLSRAYMGAISPYLERWKYDSYGAGDILPWLVNGDLLDYGRLPVLTVLLALGVSSALLARTRPALMALTLFLVMLGLFFGRPTWGKLADLLPMGRVLHFLRFAGGVHLGAILLIGLGGEWIWRQLIWLPERWRAVAVGVVVLGLIVPALRERQSHYAFNRQLMERTSKALDADEDARTILSALRELPPGRTYAGLRANWGKEMKFGDLHFYDLLTFNRIVAILPPYQGHSLNADFIFHFDDRNPAHYDLFNVRYVVAPTGLTMATFLRPIKATSKYTLYRAQTSGYARFVAVSGMERINSQSDLFLRNRGWFLSPDPAAGRFIRYTYPAGRDGSEARTDRAGSQSPGSSGCPGGGRISEERVLPGRIDLRVECQEAATLALKVTYHPNWQVTMDGNRVRPAMVSPSFIGLDVPAGPHIISAEYRSPWHKSALLLLGAFTLIAAIWFRRRFARIDASLCLRR
jgi:hypothetical protein